MLADLSAMAVLPASDLARARGFWRDVLGREPVATDAGGDVYDVGGTAVLVYETQFAGTAQNTALALVTEDLDGDLAELRARGAVFIDYDLPGFTTVDGVVDMDGERGAWFNDSEGNIIGISTLPAEAVERWRAMRSGA